MSHYYSTVKQEFPELGLTQSVISDVLQANNNNKEQATQVLRKMRDDISEALAKEKEDKVKELHEQFALLSREEIIATLEANRWDVDASIAPLFSRLESLMAAASEQAQKKREEDIQKQPKPEETGNLYISSLKVPKESPFANAVSYNSAEQRVVKVTATPAIVDCGHQITVEWEVSGRTSGSDWIGFFAVDQPNKNYVTYEWRGKEENKGKVVFTAPSTFGEYEFRYVPYGAFEHIGISNRVRVGPDVELSASLDKENKKLHVKWNKKSGNNYNRAWVGLYDKAETNNKRFIAWQYTLHPYTEAVFDAPIKPGDYEFRYFPYSYYDVALSNAVTIEGKDVLQATVEADGCVTATISVVTVDPYYDGVWLGLYFASEKNNKNLKRYKYITERVSTVHFRPPEDGEYQFRLFAKKSYDALLVSNTLTAKKQ